MKSSEVVNVQITPNMQLTMQMLITCYLQSEYIQLQMFKYHDKL